jgi:hypothetical protein
MPFQKIVNYEQALGVPGSLYDKTPYRVTAYKLDNIDSTDDVIGRVFTFDANGEPVLGGTGKFAGILLHPLEYARLGLEASGALREGQAGSLADAGRVIVITTAAAAIGAKVQYSTLTGEIAGTAPDEPAAGMAILPGAIFALYAAAAGELTVVQLDSSTLTIINQTINGGTTQ